MQIFIMFFIKNASFQKNVRIIDFFFEKASKMHYFPIYSSRVKGKMVFLELITNRFYHLESLCIERHFWHFCIYYDVHISCYTITGSSFSLDFELCTRLGPCFYFESQSFSIHRLKMNFSIKKKIKERNFNSFYDIKT